MWPFELNSSSVAPLRWTMNTSLANEVFGQVSLVDKLWASFNDMYFVSQRSPREKHELKHGKLRWMKLTSFSNEIFGKACDLNLYTDLTPALNAVHFVSQRSPRENCCFIRTKYLQLRWTKPTSFSNEALGKKPVFHTNSLHKLVVNVSNKMFCKIDKRGRLLTQTISYLFVDLQNILLLTLTTRLCREIVWKTGIPEGFVGGRSELRSTKL